jgi:hypothetical protein
MTDMDLKHLARYVPEGRRWRVMVCGGRYNQDRDQVAGALDQLWELCNHHMALIEGGHPTGTDLWAVQWAKDHFMELELHHLVAMPDDMRDVQARAYTLWSYNPDVVLQFPGASPVVEEIRSLADVNRVPVWVAESRLEVVRI